MLPTSIVDPGESMLTRLLPVAEAPPKVGTGLIVPAVVELLGGCCSCCSTEATPLIGSSSDDAPNGFTEANGGLPDDDDPITALRVEEEEDELLGNDEDPPTVALLLSVPVLNAVVLCGFAADPKLKAAVDGVLGTSALDEGSAGKAVTENAPVLSDDVAPLNDDDDDDALKVKGLLPELCESEAPNTNGFELDELLLLGTPD